MNGGNSCLIQPASDSTNHHWYAEQLGTQGRFDEALRESERARALDPLSLIIAADKAAILYQSRQYDRAIEQCRAVLEIEPTFPRAHHVMVFAYIQEGRFAEALADIETWHDDPTKTMMLAYVYGRSGQKAQAEQQLAKLEELNRRKQIDSGVMFFAYIGMGDNDQALRTLEEGYSQHSNVLRSLKVDAVFDPLRSDLRFQDLLRRVGLAQ
jgi:tetratricopeptide (TPR) repeat protein